MGYMDKRPSRMQGQLFIFQSRAERARSMNFIRATKETCPGWGPTLGICDLAWDGRGGVDLDEPTHTPVPCWMPKPLSPINQCTDLVRPIPREGLDYLLLQRPRSDLREQINGEHEKEGTSIPGSVRLGMNDAGLRSRGAKVEAIFPFFIPFSETRASGSGFRRLFELNQLKSTPSQLLPVFSGFHRVQTCCH